MGSPVEIGARDQARRYRSFGDGPGYDIVRMSGITYNQANLEFRYCSIELWRLQNYYINKKKVPRVCLDLVEGKSEPQNGKIIVEDTPRYRYTRPHSVGFWLRVRTMVILPNKALKVSVVINRRKIF